MRPLHLILAGVCSLTLAASACSSSTETAAATRGTTGTGGDGGTGGAGGGTGGTPIVDAGPDVDNGAPSDVYPAPHPGPPKVVTLGGPVLKKPKFYPVFFSNDADTGLITDAKDFISKVGATMYWTATTQEYGAGPGTGMPPIDLAEAAAPSLTDDAIQQWLAGKINSDDPQFLNPDPEAIFVLFYPTGTTISLQGQQSCSSFGGYHSSVGLDAAHGGGQVAYAVIPRCADFGGMTGIDAVTATTSHELIEASTDPYPQVNPAFGQVDNNHIYWLFALGGGENADMCAQFESSFGVLPELPYVVQRSWSNKAIAASHDPCVPSPQGQAYFNSVPVLPDQLTLGGGGQTIKLKGVLIPVGESRTVEIDLFSDGPTAGEWTVEALDSSGVQGGPKQLDFSWDRDHGVNGEKLHLTINVVKASQYKAEIFYLISKLGNQHNLWIGIVGN